MGAENTASKDIWEKIYLEIFPTSEYDPADYQLEVYPQGDGSYPHDVSEVWISVRKSPKVKELVEMMLERQIAKGATAEIYLVDDKAVKVFFDWLPDENARFEADKQKQASKCGAVVPRIFDVTRINGRQAIVMEYIKGQSFGQLLEQGAESADHLLARSVEVQHTIHAVTAVSLESMADKLERQIRHAELLDEETQTALLLRLSQIPNGNKLCHGDFHLYNLIMSGGGRVAVIDWVDASIGDPCADVYRTYLLYAQFSQELAAKYVDTYCQRSDLSIDDILRWAPIVAGARLSEKAGRENPDFLLRIVGKHM